MRITSTRNESVPLRHYNFIIHGIPKVLAIILANEVQYSVSEIEVDDQNDVNPRQKELHSKWVNIFYDSILKSCPNLPESEAAAIAVRNANYLKSAFSPITIEYGVDLRNLGFIINRCKRFISRGNFDGPSDFYDKLCISMAEFVQQIEEKFNNNLKQDEVDGSLVSFERVIERDSCGNGAINRSCLMSLDCLFDVFDYNDRISCSWSMLAEQKYITPHVINEYGTAGLCKRWQNDIDSIADLYPLGMLVKVSEFGSMSAFSRKIERITRNSVKLSYEMISQSCALLYSYKNALKFPNVEKDEYSIFAYLDRCDIRLKKTTGCSCVNPCE